MLYLKGAAKKTNSILDADFETFYAGEPRWCLCLLGNLRLLQQCMQRNSEANPRLTLTKHCRANRLRQLFVKREQL